ncbi:MAG TPA: PAS domain-containing protein, partial [Candidatus Angelobacter sp.]
MAKQRKAVKPAEYDPIAELVRVNPVPSMMIQMETLAITVVNDAAVNLVGYSERELIGRPITELV